MKSTRRLSIQTHDGTTLIRYQWCPTFVRYALWLFLVVAVAILTTEQSSKALSLRNAIELLWAAMVLSLVLIASINWNEVIVTPHEVQIRCVPISISPQRTIRRSDIVAIHHWAQRRKGIQYRVAIHTGSPVHLGAFATRDEARMVADAIAARLQTDCRESAPAKTVDLMHLLYLLRIVACLAAPLIAVLLLEIAEN